MGVRKRLFGEKYKARPGVQKLAEEHKKAFGTRFDSTRCLHARECAVMKAAARS